jgi:hypothetical protein
MWHGVRGGRLHWATFGNVNAFMSVHHTQRICWLATVNGFNQPGRRVTCLRLPTRRVWLERLHMPYLLEGERTLIRIGFSQRWDEPVFAPSSPERLDDVIFVTAYALNHGMHVSIDSLPLRRQLWYLQPYPHLVSAVSRVGLYQDPPPTPPPVFPDVPHLWLHLSADHSWAGVRDHVVGPHDPNMPPFDDPRQQW